MKAAPALASVLLLGACATADTSVASLASYDILQTSTDVRSADGPSVEALYAVAATREGLRLRVPSNGCTTKADFKMTLLPRPSSGASNRYLILFRVKRDECQSFAMGSTWIEFSYAEIGLTASDKVQLSNPLVAWTGPGD